MTSYQYNAVVTIQKLWRAHIFKKMALSEKIDRQIVNICGPEWGAYPSDSEFMCDSDYESDYEPAYEPTCEPACESESKSENDYCETAMSYMADFSIKPIECRDEAGTLLSLTFASTENTPKYWGVSMTINYEQSEEVWSEGEEIDYRREAEYYDC